VLALFSAIGPVVVALSFMFYLDRLGRRHDRVLAELCQRIQAPDTAVATHVVQQVQAPAHLPFDDDEAFMSYMAGETS
jgi:hypothetical protein